MILRRGTGEGGRRILGDELNASKVESPRRTFSMSEEVAQYMTMNNLLVVGCCTLLWVVFMDTAPAKMMGECKRKVVMYFMYQC